eukprot:2901231-Pyramimonas_sp.AAC.1
MIPQHPPRFLRMPEDSEGALRILQDPLRVTLRIPAASGFLRTPSHSSGSPRIPQDPQGFLKIPQASSGLSSGLLRIR